MGLHGFGYRLVLLAHLISAVVGFGGVLLNGVYGAKAKARRGGEGLAIAEANYQVSMVAEIFIYATPVFGLILVPLSDGVYRFSELWVWLSVVVYVVSLAVSLGVQLPTVRRMVQLMRELAAGGPPPAGAQGPPPQALELEERGKRVAMTGMVLDVLFVVILVLMVWKPT